MGAILKVGHLRYVVTFDADILQKEELRASICSQALIIKISSRMPAACQRTSLLHEILHACVAFSGPRKLDEEEAFADCIDNPLMMVLSDPENEWVRVFMGLAKPETEDH